jgi:hypothetical protein
MSNYCTFKKINICNMFQCKVHQQKDLKTTVNAHSGFLICVSSNKGKQGIPVQISLALCDLSCRFHRRSTKDI